MKYIYGINRSGKSIINYLESKNENYYCWDDNAKIRKELTKFNNKINLVKPISLNIKSISESFISPGISLRDKKLKILKDNKIKMFRDLELYSRLSKNKKIIAITGTNGKSTTTKLIGDILEKNNIKIFSGGNIGTPLLDFNTINNSIKFHIIELSSFQLESFISFEPFISILLNISPDHLDRYRSYEEYILQKEKIISCNNSGYNIVSIDHEKTFEIFNKYKNRTIPISLKPINKGIYYEDCNIIDNFFEEKKNIPINTISSSLYGSFNIENILAAYTVSKILNLKIKNFQNVIKNFKGLPHRLEKFYYNDLVQIINNSKATNVQACLSSITNYENINLILGGRTKHNNFKKILNFKHKINKIYLIGESAPRIFKELNPMINCVICIDLEVAIKKICIDINQKQKFQTILFSPACASFDQFLNFEDRGTCFKNLVYRYFNA